MAEDVSTPGRELLERFERGEVAPKDLNSALFDIYYPLMMGYAAKFGFAPSAAESIVQNALLHALRYAVTFRATNTFTSILLMHVRRGMYEANPSIASALDREIAEAGAAVGQDLTEAVTVRNALERVLAPDETQILFLHYTEQRSAEQIATDTGEPAALVASRLDRAKTRFTDATEGVAERSTGG